MFRGCVTLVTGLAFLALAFSVFFYLVIWPKEKIRQTTVILHELERAEKQFREEMEEPLPIAPDGFAAALLGDNSRDKAYLGTRQIPQREGRFTDFWRRDIVIEKSGGKGRLTFLSIGPDGEKGTDDDLTPADFRTHFPERKDPENAGEEP
ncbi:MAG: hypothetical protein AAGJ79_05235 [Verrucomicrobiota bacterium]